MNNFSIGIVTYNSSKYITELLKSVDSSKLLPYEIIIVDNNSSDNTLEEISKFEKILPIRIIKNEHNLGHSSGCNTIIRSSNTRYIILQDHDTVIDKYCYEYLYKHMINTYSDVCAVTATIQNESKYGGNKTYGSDIHFLVSSIPRFNFRGNKVSICSTTCVIIDLKKCNDQLFDEEFFIYQNDLDFFYRLTIMGHSLEVCHDAIAYHREGTSTISGRKGQIYSKDRLYYLNRNRIYFYLKNYSISTLILLSPALILFEFFAFMFSLIKRNGFLYVNIVINIFHSFNDFRLKRKLIQNKRQFSDFNLLSSGIIGFSESSKNSYFYIILFINKVLNINFNIIKKIYGILR